MMEKQLGLRRASVSVAEHRSAGQSTAQHQRLRI